MARLKLAPEPTHPETVDAIAGRIAHAFGVANDEVGCWSDREKGKLLKFVFPDKLRTIGTIPLSSTGSLAAKTAREKRGEISDKLGTRGMRLYSKRCRSEDSGQIQKMSAPILLENKTIGVVQISRKARSQEESGTDFRSDDLRKLQIMSTVLAKFVEVAIKS